MAEKGIKRTFFLVLLENRDRLMRSDEIHKQVSKRLQKKVKPKTIREMINKAYNKGLIERGVIKRGYRYNNIKPVRILDTVYENWRGLTR